MLRVRLLPLACLPLLCLSARADELLYGYEGNVLPHEDGWIVSECTWPCSQRVENGYFVLHWVEAADHVQFRHHITTPPQQDPESLWVEFRFRSNHQFPWHTFTCDARFMVDFSSVESLLNTYGDAIISQSGDDVYCCFPLDEFHTYRFETSDGVNFYWSLDGEDFLAGVGFQWNGYSSVFFAARGGCIGDKMKDLENAWDYIRYGTLSDSEIIVSADPPRGFLDARAHVGVDRFLITFDQPAYAYIDDITVGSDVPPAPQVIATRRRDNGEPDELEIVLDRPIPLHGTTQFLIDTGAPRHRVVTYTFAPGDTDGDADADLADFAWLQNCAGIDLSQSTSQRSGDSGAAEITSQSTIFNRQSPIPLGPCLALDAIDDGAVDVLDHAQFTLDLSGPTP